MNEGSEKPKALPSEPKTISPEILEKFSKGEIQLGEGMAIKGEGEERKITITLIPDDDPSYLDYLKRVKSATELARNIGRLAGGNEPENKTIGIALNLRRAEKQTLNNNALYHRVNIYIDGHMQDFSRRTEAIPENESGREQLLSEVGNFNDLVEYIGHLIGQNAYEVILPEQQIQEAGSQK